MANLALIDAIVLLAYLAGVVCLGAWLGRGKQDASQYLLGGNNAPWWAILGSIVATETSTVTFLSVPGITFAAGGDLRFLQLALGFIVGRTVIVYWLLPWYFRGKLFTVYELLRDRFGKSAQKMASLIFIVTRNLGDGLRLFLTAVVLEATLGWPLPACVVVIGVATIVFTVLGGMRSVIWNDCIQLLVYMIGGLLAFFLIAGRLDGGISELFEFARDTGRLRMFDFAIFDGPRLRLDESYTFWAGMLGGATLTLGTHGTDQMFVQRALAARSQADAGRALFFSGVFVFVQFALFLCVGIALAAFYAANPPAEQFASSDRVFSTYIVHEMPAAVGLIGLMLAAVFSAAMSTLSSSLNSSASAVVNGWILPTRSEYSDQQIVWASRVLTVLFGLLQIAIAIFAADFDEAVINNALAIAGFSAGLLLGVFALGTFVQRADQTSAMIGLVFGAITLLAVKFLFGSLPDESPWAYKLAWPWFPIVGATTTLFVGWSHALLVHPTDQ